MNPRLITLIIFLVYCLPFAAQRIAVKGVVVQSDSATPLPFVYLISKGTGNGTMTDQNGRFLLITQTNDTLVCSYVGYHGMRFPVNQLVYDDNGEARIIMHEQPVQMKEIPITAFRIKPYEREYMRDIIDRSKMRQIDMAQSPITALYMQFSKEGRQIRKLAKIFEDLLTEEQVLRRFSPEILHKLTGDATLNYDEFRRYCFFTDTGYILSVDDMTLYARVMECYRRYKAEMKRAR